MSTTTAMTMTDVHELLVAEIGRLARPLEHDGTVQLLDIPGGRFAVVVRMTSGDTLTVSKIVDDNVDFERPGLAAFLMREHANLIFGRFECIEERRLSVEHSVFADGLTGPQIMRLVLAVHSAAIEAHKTLVSVGVIDDGE